MERSDALMVRNNFSGLLVAWKMSYHMDYLQNSNSEDKLLRQKECTDLSFLLKRIYRWSTACSTILFLEFQGSHNYSNF